MRPVLIAALLLIAGSAPLSAAQIEFSGYYEPQYMGAYTDGEFSGLFSNKLRAEAVWRISGDVYAGGNLNFFYHEGRTSWNLLEFVPESVRSAVPDDMQGLYTFRYENEVLLDNLFMKVSLEKADLTLGKQQISMGTGYAWNPTDLFNVKDLTDPAYEQEGHAALRIDVPFGARSSAVAIYAVDDELENPIGALRLKRGTGRFDYSLCIAGASRSGDDERTMLGADAAGEVLDMGVWAEFAYNLMNGSDDFSESVLGTDHTFRSGLYVMGEYYRNSLGKASSAGYDLEAWMGYLSGSSRSLCRDQVYLMGTVPVTDLINAGLSVAASLNDRSFMMVPVIEYSLLQNMDIRLFFSVPAGEQGTVFDRDLGSAGAIRARLYF